MKKIIAFVIAIGILMPVTTFVSTITQGDGQQPSPQYFKRLTIVAHDENSFTDDFIYLSAIPTSLYYQSSIEKISSLTFDESSNNEKYLIQDIASRWGSETQIVKIGNVNSQVLDHFSEIAQPGQIITITNPVNSAESYAAQIATTFWPTSNKVIIAPLPDMSGQGGLHSYVEYVQAASNAAVIASLLKCPLLYVYPDSTIPQATINALTMLCPSQAIIVRPAGFSSFPIIVALSNMGITVSQDLSTIQSTIQYIRSIKNTNYLTLIYNNYESRKWTWSSDFVYKYGDVNQYLLEINAEPVGIVMQGMTVNGETYYIMEAEQRGQNGPETIYVMYNENGYWYWIPETLPGSIGDADEMPFGPAAFIAAHHASPVLTFPTDNTHCQNADDNAENLGNWMYDIYKHNWLYSICNAINGVFPRIGQILGNLGLLDYWENTPDYDDMVPISNEFYSWLLNINADNPFRRENIMVIADIAEIDPSLDRALLGKAMVGRIGSGEGPDSSYIINRNVLYPELIQINQGNDVLTSFIAYAHGELFTDNNEIEHQVYESVDVPLAYQQAGYTLDYKPTIEGATDALAAGVRFWIDVGDADYGNKPVTGQGTYTHFLPEGAWRGYEQGGSSEDPDKYTATIGILSPPDGEVNPPWARNPDKGITEVYVHMNDTDYWTELSGNLHSAAIYFLLCNIGGCQMPVLWQKSGASVVIAAYDSVSFPGGGQFDIRLNQEIASGKTFGDAMLIALRETSSIYSEGLQGSDDTLQYIIYGDPSLKLVHS